MGTDAGNAAQLVGRMTVLIGLALVSIGLVKAGAIAFEGRRGTEALATIEAAASRNFGTGGWVDLSWQDVGGTTRQALGVEVTQKLGRKLRLGSSLTRSHLRIRYQPDSLRTAVVVVEDLPEQYKRAGALCIAGFLAITAGSFVMLTLLLRRAQGGGGAAVGLGHPM